MAGLSEHLAQIFIQKTREDIINKYSILRNINLEAIDVFTLDDDIVVTYPASILQQFSQKTTIGRASFWHKTKDGEQELMVNDMFSVQELEKEHSLYRQMTQLADKFKAEKPKEGGN